MSGAFDPPADPKFLESERVLWKRQVETLQNMVTHTENHATNCINLSKVICDFQFFQLSLLLGLGLLFGVIFRIH